MGFLTISDYFILFLATEYFLLFLGRGESFRICARQLVVKAGSERDVSGGKWVGAERGKGIGESY